MNRIVIMSLVSFCLAVSSDISFADDLEDAGIGPLTPKEAMFVGNNQDSTDSDSATPEDAGLASEIYSDTASAQAGVEDVDSAMDVGMDY